MATRFHYFSFFMLLGAFISSSLTSQKNSLELNSSIQNLADTADVKTDGNYFYGFSLNHWSEIQPKTILNHVDLLSGTADVSSSPGLSFFWGFQASDKSRFKLEYSSGSYSEFTPNSSSQYKFGSTYYGNNEPSPILSYSKSGPGFHWLYNFYPEFNNITPYSIVGIHYEIEGIYIGDSDEQYSLGTRLIPTAGLGAEYRFNNGSTLLTEVTSYVSASTRKLESILKVGYAYRYRVEKNLYYH